MSGPVGRFACLVCAILLTAPTASSLADEFDRLGEVDLSPDSLEKHAHKHDGLNFRAIAALPNVLSDTRSSLLIVVTDQGNIARLTASPGFRKVPGDPDKLTPTLVLERFETRATANRSAPVSKGKEAWLFDGFGYDLDAGQVVPLDQGADIRFVASGPDDGLLSPVGTAKLFAVESLPPLPKAPTDRPSEGRVVRPGDYNGAYRLVVNGVWSGLLELKVAQDAAVTGTFRSDSGGEARPVTGQAAEGGGNHHVEFTIAFPRTRQNFKGWLWGEGKNVMAGSASMLDQSFGFIAVREGATASLTGAGLKITGPASGRGVPRTLTVDDSGETYLLDADPSAHPLTDLAELIQTDPDSPIVVKATASAPFERVRRFLQALEDLGARSVRLAPVSP